MKKKNLVLLTLAVVLVLSASIGTAFGYFTTYAEAKGGYVIRMGDTTIDEEFVDWTKRVVITSTDENQPVYVRAKAFAGDKYPLTYSGEGWSGPDEDGYYYYDQILYGGESTSPLNVAISGVPKNPKLEGVTPEDEIASPGDALNVVVIYETTPVQYDENGNPYADWNLVLKGGTE